MKKQLFLGLTALAMLSACSKSDDNSQTQSGENQSVKKIKEVQSSFLKQEYNSNYEEKNEPPYLYTLTNATTSYEYDEEGRITKIINKEEGKAEKVYKFEYSKGKIVANFEGKISEISLNDKGFISKANYIYFYDEKGHLSYYDNETFSWENGNLSQILETSRMRKFTTNFSYYPNENKNKFFIFNLEGDIIGTYLQYFDLQKVFPIGVPTKNLVKSIETIFENNDSSIKPTKAISSFDYTYDAEGYVTNIVESEKGGHGRERSGGTASNIQVEKLEQLMAEINSGAIKNVTYQIHENANGVYRFDFTHNYHITRDTNGKAIDVKFTIFKTYKFLYTEAGGVRNYTSFERTELRNREASTSYRIIYQ